MHIAAAIRRSVHTHIVHDDDLTALAALHIKLDAICALIQRQPKCS